MCCGRNPKGRLCREKQKVSTVVAEFTLSVSRGPARGAILRGKSSFGFYCVIARPDPFQTLSMTLSTPSLDGSDSTPNLQTHR